MQPASFDDDIGDSSVLDLSTRPGDGVLALGGPRDQVVAEKDVVA